ncbi:hypothetical protein SUNI508_12803 [Seiridium unicorne]|uniref:Uncharacterized protein n=1 Tax=Seiridium unicorne TaxID=138068 RepID=A0ABR2VHM5_9PEZI
MESPLIEKYIHSLEKTLIQVTGLLPERDTEAPEARQVIMLLQCAIKEFNEAREAFKIVSKQLGAQKKKFTEREQQYKDGRRMMQSQEKNHVDCIAKSDKLSENIMALAEKILPKQHEGLMAVIQNVKNLEPAPMRNQLGAMETCVVGLGPLEAGRTMDDVAHTKTLAEQIQTALKLTVEPVRTDIHHQIQTVETLVEHVRSRLDELTSQKESVWQATKDKQDRQAEEYQGRLQECQGENHRLKIKLEQERHRSGEELGSLQGRIALLESNVSSAEKDIRQERHQLDYLKRFEEERAVIAGRKLSTLGNKLRQFFPSHINDTNTNPDIVHEALAEPPTEWELTVSHGSRQLASIESIDDIILLLCLLDINYALSITMSQPIYSLGVVLSVESFIILHQICMPHELRAILLLRLHCSISSPAFLGRLAGHAMCNGIVSVRQTDFCPCRAAGD